MTAPENSINSVSSSTSRARVSGIPRPSRIPLSTSYGNAPSSSNDANRLRFAQSMTALKPRASHDWSEERIAGPSAPARKASKDALNNARSGTFKIPSGRPSKTQIRRPNSSAQPDGALVQRGRGSRPSSSLSMVAIEERESQAKAEQPRTNPTGSQSLSDRTMESIATITPSGKSRRRSSFFSPQSPMVHSRPGSALAVAEPDRRDLGTPISNFQKSIQRAKATPHNIITTTPLRTKLSVKTPQSSTRTFQNRQPSRRPMQLATAMPHEVRTTQSSVSLRDQIKLAKSRHREGSHNGASAVHDLSDVLDPFNQMPDATSSDLKGRIVRARTEGRLNIAAMGLTAIPGDILTMYTFDPNAENISWGEFVDLTALIAADNELEHLPPEMFPDVDLEDEGFQFGGLRSIDLHGNLLTGVPRGFARLELLTSLNLSRNKLGNNALDIISQVRSLVDLKLGGNSLHGELPACLCKLKNLEVLELQDNVLDTIPGTFSDLIKLRVLNVANNKLVRLPTESLATLPLVDLNAAKNELQGPFLGAGIRSWPTLQRLMLAGNRLTSVTDGAGVALPALGTLDISFNLIARLPSVASWSVLSMLLAEDNKLSELPEGLTNLQFIRTINLKGNELRRLDPELANMQGLANLHIAANPIRESKFLTMTTEEIKDALRLRLTPPDDAS